MDIRAAILQNIKGNSLDQLEATIVDAIQDGQEKLLPGLGFLFELIWMESDEQAREEMVHTLEEGVANTTG